MLQEDTEPLAVMVDLARRYPDAKIIFSGGTSRSVAGPSEAATVKGYFVSFGIDPDRILTEGQSQTTEENAIFTDHLLRPMPSSGWLLVTSAHHMPRAMGAFRKPALTSVLFRLAFGHMVGATCGNPRPLLQTICGASMSLFTSGSD